MTSRQEPYVRRSSVWVVAVAAFAIVSIAFIVVDMWRKGAAIASALAIPNLALYLLAALPFGLPATLIGAWLAHRQLVARPGRRRLGAWVSQGVVVGALLGAANCGAWLGLLVVSSRQALDPRMLVAGALPGVIVGVAVAVWCWRLSASA